MKALAYIRVSTELQDHKAQLQAIEAYCKKNGIEILEVYGDTASGTTDFFSRPSVQRMLQRAKQLQVPLIVCYDLTRIGRFNDPENLFDVLKRVSEEGLILQFAAEPVIQDPMMLKFWQFLKSWFSTYERIMISQRTKYGLAKLRSTGKLFHRPSLEHYYAAWLHNKKLNEVGRDEVEAARKQLKALVQKALSGGQKKTRLIQYLMENELKGLYQRFPNAPKKYWALDHILKEG